MHARIKLVRRHDGGGSASRERRAIFCRLDNHHAPLIGKFSRVLAVRPANRVSQQSGPQEGDVGMRRIQS